MERTPVGMAAPRNDGPSEWRADTGRPGLCFTRDVFFSPRFLRDPSTDCPETLPHDRTLATGLFQPTCREARVITCMGTIFTRVAQKNCDGKKSSKIRRDFWKLSTLNANISGTDQHIESRKSSWKSTTPPTLEEKSLCTLVHKRKFVYFGPQTKKLLT